MQPCWKYVESERPAPADIVVKLQDALDRQFPRRLILPEPLHDDDLRYLPEDDTRNLRVIKDYKAETTRVGLRV